MDVYFFVVELEVVFKELNGLLSASRGLTTSSDKSSEPLITFPGFSKQRRESLRSIPQFNFIQAQRQPDDLLWGWGDLGAKALPLACCDLVAGWFFE